MIKRLANFLNYTLIFTKRERALFYKIMSSQLNAGVSEGAATATITKRWVLLPGAPGFQYSAIFANWGSISRQRISLLLVSVTWREMCLAMVC